MAAPGFRHIEALLPGPPKGQGGIATKALLSGISEKHGALVKTGSLAVGSSVNAPDVSQHTRPGSLLS